MRLPKRDDCKRGRLQEHPCTISISKKNNKQQNKTKQNKMLCTKKRFASHVGILYVSTHYTKPIEVSLKSAENLDFDVNWEKMGSLTIV